MTLSFASKSIVELLLIVLLAYGFYHEDKVVRFERKAARVIRLLINSYRQEHARKKLTVHNGNDNGRDNGAFVA
jgi:hypothetical protein